MWIRLKGYSMNALQVEQALRGSLGRPQVRMILNKLSFRQKRSVPEIEPDLIKLKIHI